MKYISTLFVVVALLTVSTVNAQTASKLNSQSYTYVMKDMSGLGPEIIDQMSFGVGEATSGELGKTGYSKGKVVEKNAGATSTFEITFNNAAKGTYVYKGTAAGVTIDGTIDVTDVNGVQTTMAFRGMLTEEWNNMIKEKEAARQKK
jgi:hypothetical protein